MGSKNLIAKQIINAMPPADYFVDLFGGGGAVTHCALLSGKFKHIIFNDLYSTALLQNAIMGNCFDCKAWVSKDVFRRLPQNHVFRLIFSFGCKLNTYAYSDFLEPIKKYEHEKIFRQNNIIDLNSLNIAHDNYVKYRAKLYKILPDYMILNNNKISRKGLVNCDSFMRYYRINSLFTLNKYINNITFFSLDYKKVEIPANAIVYCDPPYANTQQYKFTTAFDNTTFSQWIGKISKKNMIFVSEYKNPCENILQPYGAIEKLSTLSKKTSFLQSEYLFSNTGSKIDLQNGQFLLF